MSTGAAEVYAEWLRWAALDLDLPAAEALGRKVQDLARSRRSEPAGAVSHQDAAEIAGTVLDSVTHHR